LSARYRKVQQRFEFAHAKENFFKAARYGLDVTFNWFDGAVTARELILDELLPLARASLDAAGIDPDDSKRSLDIIRDRTASGRTGAQWLIKSFTALRKSTTPEQALYALTAGLLARQDRGLPVHQWQVMQPAERDEGTDRYSPVHKIMATDLYKVKDDDAIDLVAHLMHWKHVGHVPVESADGEFVGMITRNTLIDFMLKRNPSTGTPRARELMMECPLRITPETPVYQAIALMLAHAASCLPVTSGARIVGIVTDHDLLRIAHNLVDGCGQAVGAP
jgi:CBS domain-containing protein